MKNTYFVALSLMAALVSTGAQAQNRTNADIGYYGEIAYAPIEVGDGSANTSKPTAARFIIGKDLSPTLALEGMYTTTLSKDDRGAFNATVSNYGIHLKPKMALTPDTLLFARLGVTRSDITASAAGSHKGNDFSYGVGVQTNITKTVYGQLDYMNYFDKDNTSAKGFALSVGSRF
jgi:Outer membrane protein beta-barrel domain